MTAQSTDSTGQQFIEDMVRVRGIEFARIGMTVEVYGDTGTIQGMNANANLQVVFQDQEKHGSHPHNCHPTHCVKYFDEAGEVIAHFDESGCVFRPSRRAA
jgi:hypothetical protein